MCTHNPSSTCLYTTIPFLLMWLILLFIRTHIITMKWLHITLLNEVGPLNITLGSWGVQYESKSPCAAFQASYSYITRAHGTWTTHGVVLCNWLSDNTYSMMSIAYNRYLWGLLSYIWFRSCHMSNPKLVHVSSSCQNMRSFVHISSLKLHEICTPIIVGHINYLEPMPILIMRIDVSHISFQAC